MELNWKKLYFGRVSPGEVQEAVKDSRWQSIRLSMKSKSLETKYAILENYLMTSVGDADADAHELRMLHVRVTNYVTALSRGGLIKPADYQGGCK